MNSLAKLLVLCLTTSLAFAANLANAEEEEGAEAAPQKAQYVDMPPAFIANFGDTSKKVKFVKTEVALKVADTNTVFTVENHLPMLRHEIVMLLSKQTEDAMSSPEGQETLRNDALKAVQAALQKEEKAELVSDLLFSTFIVQN